MWQLYLITGLFGALIGSFLNVVIARLPRMLELAWRQECASIAGLAPDAPQTPFNLVTPRSRCPHCEAPVRAFDNIPVLSWLVLGGRCRVRLAGEDNTVEYGAGQSFNVPGNSSFEIRVVGEPYHYVCHFG